MRYKRLNFIIFILIVIGLNDLEAQSIYIHETGGTQTAYELSNINKLSFSSGKLLIDLFEDDRDEYVLSGLRYLNFSDSTTVYSGAEKLSGHLIKIYPNPVTNKLKIDLTEAACANGTLSILNAEGRLLKTQMIGGNDITSVNVSHLPRGVYVCHFSSEKETISVKIIKQ